MWAPWACSLDRLPSAAADFASNWCVRDNQNALHVYQLYPMGDQSIWESATCQGVGDRVNTFGLLCRFDHDAQIQPPNGLSTVEQASSGFRTPEIAAAFSVP